MREQARTAVRSRRSWPIVMVRVACLMPGLGIVLAPDRAAAVVAAVVEVGFELTGGGTEAGSFPITIPGTDNEITITPSLTFSAGEFAGTFLAVSPEGAISDGPAGIDGLNLTGGLEIRIDDEIQIGPFTVPVTAVIAGPVVATQSVGSLGMLTGLTTYVETTAGNYLVEIGPLTCSDSALGLVCSSLATALGAEFPLPPTVTEIPLPFAGGAFSDLNTSGGATAAAAIDFSIPLDPDGTSTIPIRAEIEWAETERRLVLIPEGGASIFLTVCGLGALLVRRRPGGDGATRSELRHR